MRPQTLAVDTLGLCLLKLAEQVLSASGRGGRVKVLDQPLGES